MDVDAAPARMRGLPSWLLGQAALRAQRLGNAGLGAAGAHRQQYALLSALEEGGRASQADLGRGLGIDPGDMVRLIGAMQTEGWLERTPDPADRRRKLVSITAAGRRRLHKLDGVVAQVQDDLLVALSPTQRKQLVRLLTLIVRQDRNDHPE
jgi:DNA-binding MarR family transcriptional regulator